MLSDASPNQKNGEMKHQSQTHQYIYIYIYTPTLTPFQTHQCMCICQSYGVSRNEHHFCTPIQIEPARSTSPIRRPPHVMAIQELAAKVSATDPTRSRASRPAWPGFSCGRFGTVVWTKGRPQVDVMDFSLYVKQQFPCPDGGRTLCFTQQSWQCSSTIFGLVQWFLKYLKTIYIYRIFYILY